MSVTGLPYVEAVAALRAAGRVVDRVIVTRPPGAAAGRGALRVVRQEDGERGAALILAYEEYAWPDAPPTSPPTP